LITFKEDDSNPGSFQVQVNRSRIGFWVEANSAQEAEKKFIDMAGESTLHVANYNRYTAEVSTQRDKIASLEEEIRKMKTETPEPEQFNGRRGLFRRW
jgi:hypothetical protein